MKYYIGLEDLVANAMIEIMEKRMRDGKPLVQPCFTYRDLESYGSKVVKYINKETDDTAMLILSRASTVCMFRNYSEFFEETEDEHGIKLREGKTVENLKFTFRAYKTLQFIDAFKKVYIEDDYVNSVDDAIRFLDEFSTYTPYQEAWRKVCSHYGIE